MLLGLTGPKRSGKDTVAARLVEHHGFTRVAFADALKAALVDVDPWVFVQHDETGPLSAALGFGVPSGHYRLAFLVEHAGMDAVKETREGRRLLQVFGVAIREHVSETAWLDVVRETVDGLLGANMPVVITDVRFPNELDLVASLGGLHVTVRRPSVPDTDTHVSERSIDYSLADVHLFNTTTIDDLHWRVDKAISSIRNASQEAL